MLLSFVQKMLPAIDSENVKFHLFRTSTWGYKLLPFGWSL